MGVGLNLSLFSLEWYARHNNECPIKFVSKQLILFLQFKTVFYFIFEIRRTRLLITFYLGQFFAPSKSARYYEKIFLLFYTHTYIQDLRILIKLHYVYVNKFLFFF